MAVAGEEGGGWCLAPESASGTMVHPLGKEGTRGPRESADRSATSHQKDSVRAVIPKAKVLGKAPGGSER